MFSIRDKKDEHNENTLRSKNPTVACINAKHNNMTAETASEEEAQGLEESRGSRVMLNVNLWTRAGLVNGAACEVVDILYDVGTKPPADMTFAVMVKFDHYTGLIVDGCVPIVPFIRRWKHGTTRCTRTKLPLSLAWAVTVHKSQGMTLYEAVVYVSATELAFGISYVGCSRFRAWKDMLTHPMFSRYRIFKLKKCKVLARRPALQEWMKTLA